MKYIYTKKSNESSINDKVRSSYIECTLQEIKQPIPKQWFFVEHDVQSNKVKHNVNIKENEKKIYTLKFIINKSKMFP
jgi:hypothetical protein